MEKIVSATLQHSNETWVNLIFKDGSLGSCALESPILQPWLKAGNTPDPAPTPEPPVPLTPAEKLAASGLTACGIGALG